MVTRAKSMNIALSSLLGIIIFTSKALLPSIYDKAVTIFLQATVLNLAYLVIGFQGPILTGFISGLLTASVRPATALVTFTFSALYGILVSALNKLLRVREHGYVRRSRLATSSASSSLIVGVLSAYTSIRLGLIPYNEALVAAMLLLGVAQGTAAGYISWYMWKKYLQGIIQT